ncbi:WD40-repeat-containing domain protein [Blastocladiella britannica]|nr:WD40-repeat-containing domain protein [Blastocladiella britannica]
MPLRCRRRCKSHSILGIRRKSASWAMGCLKCTALLRDLCANSAAPRWSLRYFALFTCIFLLWIDCTKIILQHYLAHVWLNETRVIASTIDGHLILFESGEPKVDVVNTQGASGLHRDALSLVSTVKGGFICGCTGGLITIYDKTDEASYRKAREVVLPEEASQDIVAMALTPNEETLLVVGRNSQMYSVVLGEGDVKLEDTRFEPFAQPFHSGAVTGMDTCIRKPLIVTCSADRSVRVWNYMDASSELVKQFAEESYSVAFHPSGLYILVGFADKLRLMNLLIDDIRAFREFPVRGCREARFSNGGQYFAAVHGNVILVYNTWTFECLGTLKGHNGKVRSLSWSADDTRLVSAGAEGAMYEWNIREMRRESENILKSCSYSCAITSSGEGSRSIYAVGSDRTLKEIVDSQVVREIHTSTVLTQLVMSHSGRMMFAATTMGSIRSIKFPFASPNGTQLGSSGNSSGTSGGGVGATAAVGSAAAATAAALAVMSSNGQTATSAMEPGDFQEHKGHAGAVTRLRVSCDDVFLFSASDDGSVLVWKISDKEAAAAAGGSTGVTGAGAARAGVSFLAPTGAGGGSGAAAIRRDMVYADEILVTKTDLEDKTATMAELRARVEELKLENEYQLRLKDMNFHEKIKETTEKYQEEIDGLKITCAVLKADREKEEVRHDEEMAEETQRHSHSMDELEANHSSKLMAEYEKYQELQNKTAMLEQSWAQQLEELQQQKQLTLEEFTTQYEALLKNKQADIDQVRLLIIL